MSNKSLQSYSLELVIRSRFNDQVDAILTLETVRYGIKMLPSTGTSLLSPLRVGDGRGQT